MKTEIELQDLGITKRQKFFLERKYADTKFYLKESNKHANVTTSEAVSQNPDETLLLNAAMNNDYDQARKLCEQKVNLECYSSDKTGKTYTPLFLTLIYGSIDVLALLLLHGTKYSSEESKSLNQNYYSWTPGFHQKQQIMLQLLEKKSSAQHLQEMETEYESLNLALK